ncbi:hypothetical protein CDEN61S_03555 [Castellaniella denitrificans]
MENSRSRGSGSSAAPGKSSNKSRLFEDLKHQILTLQLGPDEDLDEPGLCERYGLSRTPVREVFRRLSGEGYVYIREHSPTRCVRSGNPAKPWHVVQMREITRHRLLPGGASIPPARG